MKRIIEYSGAAVSVVYTTLGGAMIGMNPRSWPFATLFTSLGVLFLVLTIKWREGK